MDEQRLTKKERKILKKQQELENQKQVKQSSTFKTAGIWLLGAVLLVGGVFLFLYASKTPRKSNIPTSLNTVLPTDNTAGATSSANLLIEYSDFQCPACAANHALVKQLLTDKGNLLTFVYRNFPLEQHKNAKSAAYAAEAAALQGKYWEMSDLLFTNQNDWSESPDAMTIFTGYAQTLGLNTDQFVTDTKLESIKQKVEADLKSGLEANVMSTPTFFYNGVSLKPVSSYEDFVEQLNL